MKQTFLTIISFFLGILCTFLFYSVTNIQGRTSKSPVLATITKSNLVTNANNIMTTLPTLHFPLKYFASNLFTSGSGTTTNPSDWSSGYLSIGALTAPTTTITYKYYSNQLAALPPIPSATQWNEFIHSGIVDTQTYLAQAQTYGNLAKRFNIDNFELIASTSYADMTADGSKETIATIKSGEGILEGIYVIKNDQILFIAKTGGELLKLTPDPSHNGFSVYWINQNELTRGYCCATGNMITRFVYQDGKFVPIYEQEQSYMNVINTKSK